MRLRWVIVNSALAIVAITGIAYGELVRDWRVAVSEETPRAMMRVGRSFLVADYNRLSAAMEQKYGPAVETSVPLDTGIAEVKLDGTLVEQRSELKRISDVYGIFVVGPDDNIAIKFPFEVSVDEATETPRDMIAGRLKTSFKKAPPAWFEFTDNDWTIDQCTVRPKDLGLGSLGRAMSLRGGTYCLVTWHKPPQSATMLIGVSVAEPNSWMRPFARRICRAITEAALGELSPVRSGSLKYATCVLIDGSQYASGNKAASMHAYAVSNGSKLDRIEFGPR